jgi:hypothetical protein
METKFLIDRAIKEHDYYIRNYLDGEQSGMENSVEIILLLMRYFESVNKNFPPELLSGFKSIMVYSLKNYFDVTLGSILVALENSIKQRYGFYDDLDVLGNKFDTIITSLYKSIPHNE